VLAEGSLDAAEPLEAGNPTPENSTEEAEAENSAEMIEEAESVTNVMAESESEEADQDEIDAIGAEEVSKLDADESESEIEEEKPAKEDGA